MANTGEVGSVPGLPMPTREEEHKGKCLMLRLRRLTYSLLLNSHVLCPEPQSLAFKMRTVPVLIMSPAGCIARSIQHLSEFPSLPLQQRYSRYPPFPRQVYAGPRPLSAQHGPSSHLRNIHSGMGPGSRVCQSAQERQWQRERSCLQASSTLLPSFRSCPSCPGILVLF